MNDFKVNDEIEQSFREGYDKGYIAGRCEADERIMKIAYHYGYEAQREQFEEECAEAILAAQKVKRHGSKQAFEDLEGEIADVIIMAVQMRLLMSTKDIDKIINSKLDRQIQRIKEEENE